MKNNRIIWNWYDPIIIYRRFLKPKILYIIDTQLIKELQDLCKTHGH